MDDFKVIYNFETVQQCIGDMQDLIKEHWVEIGLVGSVNLGLDPYYEIYSILENAGHLLIQTARLGKKLVGYFIVTAHKHSHHQTEWFAQCDVLFVSKAYRTRLIGPKLIKNMEKKLKDSKVNYLQISVTPAVDISRGLMRQNYQLQEAVYLKEL